MWLWQSIYQINRKQDYYFMYNVFNRDHYAFILAKETIILINLWKLWEEHKTSIKYKFTMKNLCSKPCPVRSISLVPSIRWERNRDLAGSSTKILRLTEASRTRHSKAWKNQRVCTYKYRRKRKRKIYERLNAGIT